MIVHPAKPKGISDRNLDQLGSSQLTGRRLVGQDIPFALELLKPDWLKGRGGVILKWG